MRFGFFIALAALYLVNGFSTAQARGALVKERDACIIKIGPEIIYYSVYLASDAKERFCEDIPAVGRAIFALDFAQAELRDMKVQFRILRGDDTAAPGANLVVAELEPKTYPNGTIGLTHDFGEAGAYTGVLVVDGAGGEHWEARFPFYVGGSPPDGRKLPFFLLGVAAALAGFLLLTRGKRPKKQR